MSAGMEKTADEPTGGIPRYKGHGGNPAAGALHNLPADDFVGRVVASLDEHIGQKRPEEGNRGIFLKNADIIDLLQFGKPCDTGILRKNGAAFAFEPTNGRIAVKTEDKDIAQATGGLDTLNMALVKEVKTAVGENHRLSAIPQSPPNGDEFVRKDPLIHRQVFRQSIQSAASERVDAMWSMRARVFASAVARCASP